MELDSMNTELRDESVKVERNKVVERLSRSWSKRATVRNGEFIEVPEPIFDPDKYDFPPQLIPFKNHPDYVALDRAIKLQVETLSWIAWNKRVIDTEELVISPGLIALMNGGIDLCVTGTDRTAIRQTLVDEYFHSHMHEVAIGVTIRGRNLSAQLVDQLNRPAWVYRSYAMAAEGMEERWEKDVARLAWCVVGELSIYEFLGQVSRNPMIQPASSTLLRLHEQDEAAHASIVAQIMRDHFHEFREEQKNCFVKCLPLAMNGFAHEDWLMWQDILELAGVESARKIISEVQSDSSIPNQLSLMRSFQRVEDFCSDLGLDIPTSE